MSAEHVCLFSAIHQWQSQEGKVKHPGKMRPRQSGTNPCNSQAWEVALLKTESTQILELLIVLWSRPRPWSSFPKGWRAFSGSWMRGILGSCSWAWEERSGALLSPLVTCCGNKEQDHRYKLLSFLCRLSGLFLRDRVRSHPGRALSRATIAPIQRCTFNQWKALGKTMSCTLCLG